MVKDKALETGSKSVDAARSLSNETLDRANSVKANSPARSPSECAVGAEARRSAARKAE
ncbi:hypothetical protein ACFQ9Z_09435 [Streptomyces sp. NPDC056580]|uniref:hypothetical protein n=1 Tax=Streptomyces sp. NPDC056580 TaxID=3345872 RepID=UPI0036A6B80E